MKVSPRWAALVGVIVILGVTAALLLRSGSSSSPRAASNGVGTACTGPRTVTSWVGNTFGGKDDEWIQPSMQGLWVSSDGTAYGEAAWNEGARELRGYRDGKVIGANTYTYQHEADIPNGGRAVTGDANYVYAAVRIGDTAGVMRYDHRLHPAPFSGGTGAQGSMLVVNPTHEYLTALAASKDRLFVADPQTVQDTPASQQSEVPSETTVIHVYDTGRLGSAPITTFSVPRARGLAVDGSGGLWVLQQANGSEPAKVVRYSATGTPTGQQVTGIANPTSLAIDPTAPGAGRLLVTDNGPDQDVKIFTGLTGTPTQSATFGEKGGVLGGSTPGAVGPRRFNGPVGVGVDGAGNIYVDNNGNPSFAVRGFGAGTSLESYQPDGTLRWQVYGQKYDTAAGIDPRTGTDVYTAFDHYEVDLSKPTGRQWTRVGWTLDRFKYPYDPRINDQGQGVLPSNPTVRTIDGHRFLFMGNGNGNAINIFRFDGSSETAIPSGSLNNAQAKSSPGAGEFIWRDTDGDGSPNDNVAKEYFQPGGGADADVTGWWIDTAGNVWQTTKHGIREFELGGLDDQRNPVYGYDKLRTFPIPAPFTDVRRLAYDPASDGLTVSGYTAAHPDPGGPGAYKFAGTTLAHYADVTKASALPAPTWTTVLPYAQIASDAVHKTITLSIAGDYAFVGYFTGADNQLNSDIHAYSLKTGAETATIVPGPEIGGRTGNTDMQDGLVAYQTPAGEYLLLNEEDLFNKTVMYEWCPPGRP